MLKTSKLLFVLSAVLILKNSFADTKKEVPNGFPGFSFKEDVALAQKLQAEKLKIEAQPHSEFAVCTPIDERLCIESFSQAPALLKTLVNDMARGKGYCKKYTTILLAGPTGSGKTTLARAIAYRLNREVLVVNAPALLGRFRNQSAENIKKLFQDLENANPQPILVIDEINSLTDDYISEHSDTKQTAMQLWTLLDTFAKREGFLLIGTTNITKKMPHQLQSRFKGRTFRVENPASELRLKTLHYYLQQLNIPTDKSCTEEYLQELSKKTENCSQRDLEELIDRAILLYSHYHAEVHDPVVTREFLEKALLDLQEENSVLWDFSEHATAEQKRHVESIELSKKQFDETQKLQSRLAKLNLIYQAQMAPITFNNFHPDIKQSADVLNKSFKMVFPSMSPVAKVTEKINEHNMIDTEFQVVNLEGN